MSQKPWLEEFKDEVDFMNSSLEIADHQRFMSIAEGMLEDGMLHDIYRYAKEKTKRVEELEEEIRTHAPHGRNYTNEQVVNLRLENERYREALKFYMDKDNYKYKWKLSEEGFEDEPKVISDNGLKAWKVLNGMTHD